MSDVVVIDDCIYEVKNGKPEAINLHTTASKVNLASGGNVEDKLAEMGQSISTLMDKPDAGEQLTALKAEVGLLKTSQKEFEAKIPANLADELKGLDDAIKAAEAKQATAESRIDALEESNQAEAIESLETWKSEAQTSIAELESARESQAASIATAAEKISALEAKSASFEQEQSSISESITALTDTQAGYAERLNSSENTIAELSGAKDSQAEAISDLQSTISQLQDKIEALETKVETLENAGSDTNTDEGDE